jgi:hypothetical protein
MYGSALGVGKMGRYEPSNVSLAPNVWDDDLEILFDVGNHVPHNIQVPQNHNPHHGSSTMYSLGSSPPQTPAPGVDLSSLAPSRSNSFVTAATMNSRHTEPDADGMSVKNEDDGSGDGSVTGPAEGGKAKGKGVDKKAKRRAAVAAASRATRAKRKRELETLRETNQRLEKVRVYVCSV